MKTVSFFLCFFAFIAINGFSSSLMEKFSKAEKGSYVAFENQSMVSCLVFHSMENDHLYLYEISMPSSQMSDNFDLKEWLSTKAKDSSSFVIYSINFKTHQIDECFSFTRRSYINISDQGSFLPKLLNLNLEIVPDNKRKTIALKAGEIREHPKFWNPPKIVDGEKIKKRDFEVFQTNWPTDDSELSNKPITMYFDKERASFPFPYWIEIGQGHIVLKLRAKDSGQLETLPFGFFPTKPIEVTSVSKSSGLEITLLEALKYDKFQILASTYHDGEHQTHLIEHKQIVDGEKTYLISSKDQISQTLQKGLAYHICIFPESDPKQCIELKETYKDYKAE